MFSFDDVIMGGIDPKLHLDPHDGVQMIDWNCENLLKSLLSIGKYNVICIKINTLFLVSYIYAIWFFS